MQRQPQPVRVAAHDVQGFAVRAAVQGSDFKHIVRLGCNRPESGIYPPLAVVQWHDMLRQGRPGAC